MKKVTTKKKVILVRKHPRHVPQSIKNPKGITIVDEHPRRLSGTFLNFIEIENIVKNYDRKKIIYPTSKKLLDEYRNSDKYDELIAIWTDYFNNKFPSDPPLDPDIVKALIGSESGFRDDPIENKKAFGVTQITKMTFKALQDPKGEAGEFIFTKFILKDLKNPNIAIPMAIRWLFRKKRLAKGKLGREPSAQELILEYKGLLSSNSRYKKEALLNFTRKYDKLKK